MVCERLRGRGEGVSPEAVDKALRAFWRGSACEIDQLAGVSGDERPGLGELLLWLMNSAGTSRSARTHRRLL